VLVYVTGKHLEYFSCALALQVLRTMDTEPRSVCCETPPVSYEFKCQ